MNGGATVTDKRFIRNYIIENTKKSAGLPDIIAFKNNTCYMFEVKNEVGKLSTSQKDFNELASNYKFTQIYTVRNTTDLLNILKQINEANEIHN